MKEGLPVNKWVLTKIVLFGLAFLALTAHAIINFQFSVLFTFFIFFGIGHFLLRKSDSHIRNLFLASFFINVFFAVFFAGYFIFMHGSPFIGGGDDEAFYTLSLKLKAGEIQTLTGYNFRGYILFFAIWYKFLNIIGVSSDYYFHLNIINCFFGAFCAPLIYLIAEKLYDKKVARLGAGLTLIYPPFIFYSSTIIRDILIATLFFLIIYFLLVSNASRRLKIFVIAGSFIWLFNIRGASGFFALFFVGCYYLLKMRGVPKEIFKAFLIVTLLAVIVIQIIAVSRPVTKVAPPPSDVLNYLSYRSHYYKSLMSAQASKNSLGARIRNSNHPLVVPVSFVYTYFSPVPPLLTRSLEPHDILVGIGNVIWYYFGLLFLFTTLIAEPRKQTDYFKWGVISTAVLATIVINFSSGDPRHFYFIQPLVFLIGIDFLARNKKFMLQFSAIFLVIVLISAAAYLAIKMV